MISRDKNESKKGIIYSGNACVICGWDEKDLSKRLLVEGAHVRRFENIPDYDKFNNIIALCPNHHTEFDAGNITIDPVNKVCLSIDENYEFHNKKIKGNIKHIQKGYFDYHKRYIFKG